MFLYASCLHNARLLAVNNRVQAIHILIAYTHVDYRYYIFLYRSFEMSAKKKLSK